MDISAILDSRQDLLSRIAGRYSRTPTLSSIEVIPDSVLMDFFAFNYLAAVDNMPSGRLLIGELGGSMPYSPDNSVCMLAIDDECVQRIAYAFELLKRAEGDRRIEHEAYKIVGMPVRNEDFMMVVDGNDVRYPFMTSACHEHIADILPTARARGTYYIFNMAPDFRLVSGLLANTDHEAKRSHLSTNKDRLIPTLPGLRIKDDDITLLISENGLIKNRSHIDKSMLRTYTSDIVGIGLAYAGEYHFMDDPLV